MLKQAGDQHLGPDELRATVNHVWGREDVVLLGEDSKGELWLTTSEMLALEKRMAESAKERQGTWSHRGAGILDGAGLGARECAVVRHGAVGGGAQELRRTWTRYVELRPPDLGRAVGEGLGEG